MKKVTSLVLMLVMIFSFIPIPSVSAEDPGEIIDHINEFIKTFYGRTDNYYDKNKVDLNYVSREWNRNSANGKSYLFNHIPYKTSDKTTWIGEYWKCDVGISGKDRYGVPIIPYTDQNGHRNPEFYYWESGWGTGKLSGNSTIKKYSDDGLRTWWLDEDKKYREQYERRAFVEAQSYCAGNLSEEKQMLLEKAIQEGVDYVYKGILGQDVDNRTRECMADRHTYCYKKNGKYTYHFTSSRKDKPLHTEGESPSDGGWKDYLLIVVPPTDISWGVGWRFNKDGNEDLNDGDGAYYRVEIPIAPFNMVSTDIEVSYEQYSSSAVPGTKVEFKALAKAQNSLQNVSYEWKITDKNGNPIPGVSYSGHSSTGASGSFDITGGRSSQHKATFTMPDSDVVVSFVANGNKAIAETNYDNNRSVIDPITVRVLKEGPPVNLGEFVLDYDIYALNISAKADMTANFPAGKNYVGTGSADYYISSANNLARNLSISGNRTVSSSPFTSSVTAKATLYRETVGDKPAANKWLKDGVYSASGKLSLTGNAWREYIYNFLTGGSTTIRHYEAFNPVGLAMNASVKVYNGMPTLPSKSINKTASKAHIEWPSGAIPFNVTREMFQMDENGNRTNRIYVPGQYTRTFYGKNTADITWVAQKPMSAAYAKDRNTAKSNGTKYDLAVFSTGRDFQNVAYPLKSGYMFNPSGTYVCTVKSSVYIRKDASEAEKMRVHNELVDKVKKSFVYNNGLVYTNNGNDSYSIKNITATNPGGILSINVNNNKSSIIVPMTQYEPYMEGYDASGTIGSYNNYRYREYVKSQDTCRIDAETVITFTISSSAKKYTNIAMKDGNYSITAQSRPFDFQGMTVPQTTLSDGITVTVRGSLYDDRG